MYDRIKNISLAPSRYIRIIHLLPGVHCGSQARKEKGRFARQAEKRTIVGVAYKRGVGQEYGSQDRWMHCCRLESCGTVLLFYCCEFEIMYKGTVVLLFIFVLVA